MINMKRTLIFSVLILSGCGGLPNHLRTVPGAAMPKGITSCVGGYDEVGRCREWKDKDLTRCINPKGADQVEVFVPCRSIKN